MTFSLDDKTIDVPCRKCGQKSKETIRRLKTNPDLTCRSCGAITAVKADEIRAAEQAIKKALDNIRKVFR
ncbi:hypothetical protein [Pandoraea apista]|uniref:hypothetical protein n=1 Tax=Pandoraea apista TaxID=93218 RepID=UPI002F932FD9